MPEFTIGENHQFVYRCWDTKDNCLYVGQHTGVHPSIRVMAHHSKRWWPQVVKVDYLEVPDSDSLDDAELAQIRALHPKHNIRHTPRDKSLAAHHDAPGRRLKTFTCTDEEWDTFKAIVRDTDPEVSASHAIRELMRWYAGGCGGKLKLIIPIVLPRPPASP